MVELSHDDEGNQVNLTTIILLGLIGAPFAAGAAWVSARLGIGWNARQRVFNSAAILPTIIAIGGVGFAAVILGLGGNPRFVATDAFLIEALTAIFAMFISGMIAAYFVERVQKR